MTRGKTLSTWIRVPAAIYLLGVHASAWASFYTPQNVGSEALYNPLSSAIDYSLDTLQMPNTFDHHDFDDRADKVVDELLNPDSAINSEGGFERFVNRQIFPINTDHADEWPTMLPNYFLHLLGGGMVYRRDLEYFRYHGYARPQGMAIGIAMTAEFVQEVFEKRSTTAEDAIADILIFRPLGIWLFADDTRAAYIENKLQPAIWPNLVFYDPAREQFRNAGVSYVLRPQLFESDTVEPFVYTGLTTLFGLSHRYQDEDKLSWGIGAALTYVDPDKSRLNYKARPSAGLFYDRQGSLLWSVVINGTESLKIRGNLYPLQEFPVKAGISAGLTDDDEVYLGLTFGLPIGLGGNF